jgi:photosystem II stability/assembly factor-like uncharacterized protein
VVKTGGAERRHLRFYYTRPIKRSASTRDHTAIYELKQVGGQWQIDTAGQFSSPKEAYLMSVFFVSPTEGWAVGELFGIWHYKGGMWEQVESNPIGAGLNSVSMVSADEGWAVGGATILHYNGNKWKEVQSPTSADLLSVHMISADDGWVVGENGTILRYQNGAWGKYSR